MTIKQMQCLLTYLGYDVGIDGIIGARTMAALEDIDKKYGVGKDGLVGIIAGTVAPKKSSFDELCDMLPTGTFWDEIKWFRKDEFRCTCGRCGGFPAEPTEKLVRMVDKVREHFGAPATISSGVRCAAHNAEVGGVANSRHLKGWAVDMAIQGVSAASLDAYVGSLPECSYHYRITSNGKDTGYVHMDVVL